MKTCSKCGETKSLNDFYRRRRNSETRRSHCKACCRALHQDNREERLVAMREHYLVNRKAYIARATQWASANRARRREIVAKWSASPAGLHSKRDRESRRRALKRGTKAEAINLSVVYKRDKGRCGICGEPVNSDDWHLDHILPLAVGGTHKYDNVQVAHPTCNIRKGARASEGALV